MEPGEALEAHVARRSWGTGRTPPDDRFARFRDEGGYVNEAGAVAVVHIRHAAKRPRGPAKSTGPLASHSRTPASISQTPPPVLELSSCG